MHPCALLVDELLALVPAEEKALDAEDLDKAEELAERRACLLREIWKRRADWDETELRGLLETMRDKQNHLYQKALDLRARLRERQATGRKQTKYFNGDRHVYAQAQRSFFCSKIS